MLSACNDHHLWVQTGVQVYLVFKRFYICISRGGESTYKFSKVNGLRKRRRGESLLSSWQIHVIFMSVKCKGRLSRFEDTT